MKRVIALFTTVIAVLSLCLTAFAAPEDVSPAEWQSLSFEEKMKMRGGVIPSSAEFIREGQARTADEMMKMNGGVIPSSPEFIAAGQAVCKAEQKNMPQLRLSSCDLSQYMPTPGDQLSQNSCVAWATAYAMMSIEQNIHRGWTVNNDTHAFSPSYVYNQINGGGNYPTSFEDAIALMSIKGSCTLSYMPYVGCTTAPTQLQKENGSFYKVASYAATSSIAEIKNYLANGHPVVIGVYCYPDFNLNTNNTVYDSTSGTCNMEYGHAICLVGYNDNINAFKFVNSYGIGYGNGGFGWISYSMVSNPAVNTDGASVGYVIFLAADNYKLGDVDEDGTVTAADARLALKLSAHQITLTDRKKALSDANGDSEVYASDAQSILRYSAHLISHLPLYD